MQRYSLTRRQSRCSRAAVEPGRIPVAQSSHSLSTKSEAAEASAPGLSVVLVISSRLERLGWSIVIENQQDMQILGQFSSCADARSFLAGHTARVVVVDEAMLSQEDCAAFRQYAAGHRTRFLLVAPHPLEEPISESRYSFASQCLLKGVSANDLLGAIRRHGARRRSPA